MPKSPYFVSAAVCTTDRSIAALVPLALFVIVTSPTPLETTSPVKVLPLKGKKIRFPYEHASYCESRLKPVPKILSLNFDADADVERSAATTLIARVVLYVAAGFNEGASEGNNEGICDMDGLMESDG